MSPFVHEELTQAEYDRQVALFGPLTESVRDLIDAAIRTEVDEDTVRAAQAQIEAATAALRQHQLPGAFGIPYTDEGLMRPWGNAVIGLRNAIAPPLNVQRDDSGLAWAEFELGAAYEGPPGLVHGGVAALMIDHVLGVAVGKGGMTGTLTLRYLRGTPLGGLRVEGWVESRDGHKTFAKGRLQDDQGVTVEAEGIFVVPRWAR